MLHMRITRALRALIKAPAAEALAGLLAGASLTFLALLTFLLPGRTP